ncbi:hypothetical protein [Streptomyces sp. NPDC058475]
MQHVVLEIGGAGRAGVSWEGLVDDEVEVARQQGGQAGVRFLY